MRIRIWLQRPPRVQWVLKLTHENEHGSVTVRTWFDDYPPSQPPPPCVTRPIAFMAAAIARAALSRPVENTNMAMNITCGS